MLIGKAEVKHRVVVNGREAQLVVEQGSDGEGDVGHRREGLARSHPTPPHSVGDWTSILPVV